jgi:zinc D-Ala-D-Ala carboxypeptidase
MNKISKHITYNEGCFSNTAVARGINNHPNAEQLANMKLVAENCFEPAREHFNTPLKINSFFRSPALNKAIGGSKTSQHCLGMAIDINGLKIKNKDLGEWLMKNVMFDQLIMEFWDDTKKDYGWCHISYKEGNNRKQVLEAYKEGGKTKYRPYK